MANNSSKTSTHSAVALPIDHLVINIGRKMEQAHRVFKHLGFTLTPLGRHTMGSINHLIMLDKDYIELIGLPDDGTETRGELLLSQIGTDGLVFQSSDADQTYQDLIGRKQNVKPVQAFSRPVELDGKVSDAKFKTVRYTPGFFPAGRVYFCQHLTPELVWRSEWQSHPNGAQSIAALLIVSKTPKRDAEQYAAVCGGKAVRGKHGEYRIQGHAYELVIVSQQAYEECFGPLVCDAGGRASYFGAIAIRTNKLDALRNILEHANPDSEIRWRDLGNRIALHVPGFNSLLEFIDTDNSI